LADPSAVALYFVSRLAARYVKVALSGEGADEFFGGYNIYHEPISLRPLTELPMPLRRLLAKLAAGLPFNFKGKNYLIRGGKRRAERFIGGAYIFTQNERRQILKSTSDEPSPYNLLRPLYKRYAAHDDITQMQLIDIHMWMVGDILLKADKMSMAHSLEVRVPFLDTGVFRAAAALPTRYRVTRKGTKLAFRAAARRHLPEKTATKKKLGFPVPIRVWLREEKYYEQVKSHFTSTTARRFFNIEALVKLLDTHKSGKGDNSRKIWTVYTFLLWHEQYFKEDIK
jgi:asparagine synthase (glutamine-hydrolysing)